MPSRSTDNSSGEEEDIHPRPKLGKRRHGHVYISDLVSVEEAQAYLKLNGKHGFKTTGVGCGQGQNPRGKDDQVMKCHKCGSRKFFRRIVRKNLESQDGKCSSTTPTFATTWEGGTWVGLAQDGLAENYSCDCEQQGARTDCPKHYPTKTEFCGSYKRARRARIEGDQERIGIIRNRSGSEETIESAQHYRNETACMMEQEAVQNAQFYPCPEPFLTQTRNTPRNTSRSNNSRRGQRTTSSG